ncbi:LolA family protein [Occallatibacter riparius]|uniref:Outer membrane lipoprotein-sorting protein n=1 Tax=Occallatibacter riparius TaxID=1002689 RepID=A0A9J7BHP9_9BACT|nr:outer membrane lipoprotein-sorting protein [Occallatibacter riparius]UWZ81963.1 outer membrane lipoprotein-sorting protein [Occallatibacter riparius]
MRKFLVVLVAVTVFGAPAMRADDLDSVLRKLDAAAVSFRSTSADFKIVNAMTDPIPETEEQTGAVYYERKNKSFQMAAHIQQVDGRPVPKTYMFSGGEMKLWEGGALNQVTTLTKAGKFESYLALGFGASGKDLEEKWTITYDGDETIAGVKTAKLELVAKDPGVRKNLPKVIVWMDTTRGISMKQFFDEGQGQSRTCTYSNIKLNASLPGDAFTFPTNSKTQYIKR